MIVFRQKYSKWWFDWNVNLVRFSSRVAAYLLLLRDEYPSTDEEQAIHIDIRYPDVQNDLNRWLPLVKWLLALPHYIVLVLLWIAVVVVVIVAWFAILFTGRYPRRLFAFVVGVLRWSSSGIRISPHDRPIPAVRDGSLIRQPEPMRTLMTSATLTTIQNKLMLVLVPALSAWPN